MPTTQIPCKILLISLILLVQTLNQTTKANHIKITLGTSTVKNYTTLGISFKNYGILANLQLERIDYGELQNYTILNPNYYQKTTSFNLTETSIPLKLGLYNKTLSAFISANLNVITLTNHNVYFYYGIGAILNLTKNLSISTEIDNVNITLNETKLKTTLTYKDDFFKNLEISFHKETTLSPSIEFTGEVNILEINNFGLNLGAGYTLNFLSTHLHPYKLILKIIFPNQIEILNLTKFSNTFLDTSISLIYNFSK